MCRVPSNVVGLLPYQRLSYYNYLKGRDLALRDCDMNNSFIYN
jgi:hypothetical protein